jgi:hypothetical protein
MFVPQDSMWQKNLKSSFFFCLWWTNRGLNNRIHYTRRPWKFWRGCILQRGLYFVISKSEDDVGLEFIKLAEQGRLAVLLWTKWTQQEGLTPKESYPLTRCKRSWYSRKDQEILRKGFRSSMCHQKSRFSSGEFSMNFSRQKRCCISAILSRRQYVMCVELLARIWMHRNVDATFSLQDGQGSSGAVLWNSAEGFEGGQAQWYPHGLDAPMMEALACKDGIRLARSKRVSELQVETDMRCWPSCGKRGPSCARI